MTPETVKRYQELQGQKVELEQELRRVNAFLARPADNKDNQRAINKGKIFVKFAGTACMLPTGIFTGALQQRKNELEQDIIDIQLEIDGL